MRLTFILILTTLLVSPAAFGAGDARRAQVAAATADALATLQRDVLDTPLMSGLSVSQFLEKTGSRDTFAKALRRAEQIGGTRWLDDQTCQVRMELPGADVADALVAIARSKPQQVPVAPDVLRARVDPLRDKTFAATGMSTSATGRLRPPREQGAWQGVADEAIQAALNAARRSAASQVLDSVDSIKLTQPGNAASTDAPRLGKVLADQKVHDALEGWLMNRPVTSAEFKDDLEVRVAVAVDGESFWDELSAAVGDRKDVPFPSDEKVRDEVRRQLLLRVEPTVGRAQAKVAGATTAPREAVDVPRDPPKWVGDQVDARGTSRPVDGRLKTARAAETVARERLRGRIEELTLSRKLTLGDAARRDDHVRDAIDRAVQRVRPRKVNYLSDGGVEVTITLDLHDLWYDLESR